MFPNTSKSFQTSVSLHIEDFSSYLFKDQAHNVSVFFFFFKQYLCTTLGSCVSRV